MDMTVPTGQWGCLLDVEHNHCDNYCVEKCLHGQIIGRENYRWPASAATELLLQVKFNLIFRHGFTVHFHTSRFDLKCILACLQLQHMQSRNLSWKFWFRFRIWITATASPKLLHGLQAKKLAPYLVCVNQISKLVSPPREQIATCKLKLYSLWHSHSTIWTQSATWLSTIGRFRRLRSGQKISQGLRNGGGDISWHCRNCLHRLGLDPIFVLASHEHTIQGSAKKALNQGSVSE